MNNKKKRLSQNDETISLLYIIFSMTKIYKFGKSKK